MAGSGRPGDQGALRTSSMTERKTTISIELMIENQWT
jgi:hypothetical protein